MEKKLLSISDDGDLPENIVENTVYYAITTGSTASQLKLASSQSSSAHWRCDCCLWWNQSFEF
jgi:hypothetical protein